LGIPNIISPPSFSREETRDDRRNRSTGFVVLAADFYFSFRYLLFITPFISFF
jgi:hypothetical protein